MIAPVSNLTFKNLSRQNFGSTLLDKVKLDNAPANVSTEISSPQTTKEVLKPQKVEVSGSNLFNYLSAGIGVVGSGLGLFAYLRAKNISKAAKASSSSVNLALKNMEKRLSDIEAKNAEAPNIQEALDSARKSLDETLKSETSALKDSVKEGISNLKQKVENISSTINSKFLSVIGNSEILTREVVINGEKLNLATTLNGYGKYQAELETALRGESTKSMLGLADRTKITPKKDVVFRCVTSEFKPIASTGGMAIVPREVLTNLGAAINTKHNTRLIVDMPMYLGEISHNAASEKQEFRWLRKVANSDNTYEYLSKTNEGDGKEVLVAGKKLQKIGTMKTPIYTDNTRTIEEVEMFLMKDLEQVVDFNLLKGYLSDDVLASVNKHLQAGKAYKKGALSVSLDKDGKTKAVIKFDTILYKNDKFDMKGPRFDGKLGQKSIYNGKTTNSGETERFIYFDKFFYEGLLKSEEVLGEGYGADVIIGNDWQTGGISAMMKLLTHAKKYTGEITEKMADKLLNTPILTILHNAQLAGNEYYGKSKLFNVLFGEHAAMVVPNAYMPNLEACKIPTSHYLPTKCWNALMHGSSLNPQSMAVAYSDVVVPVSKGYNHEIATDGIFGRENFELFRLRKYVSDNKAQFGRENMIGIVNGSDRLNNIITQETADMLTKKLSLDKPIIPYKEGTSVIDWHNHNKTVVLEGLARDIKNVEKNKNLFLDIHNTDLTGVNANTMVIGYAGRISGQKGLDILAEAIMKFLRENNGKFAEGNYPVFYIQGTGDKTIIDNLLRMKSAIAACPDMGGAAAAKRIVVAHTFDNTRYNACKLVSDFSNMPSWYEPCGLSHKEFAAYSGAIPIVNKTGGLVEGLANGENCIVSDYVSQSIGYKEALNQNSSNFAKALSEAFNDFQDKEKFAKMLASSFKNDLSWLAKGGPIQQYLKILVDLKVLKPEVLG